MKLINQKCIQIFQRLNFPSFIFHSFVLFFHFLSVQHFLKSHFLPHHGSNYGFFFSIMSKKTRNFCFKSLQLPSIYSTFSSQNNSKILPNCFGVFFLLIFFSFIVIRNLQWEFFFIPAFIFKIQWILFLFLFFIKHN